MRCAALSVSVDVDRSAHLEWCKRRALDCLDAGQVHNAVASMLSGLHKHPETVPQCSLQLERTVARLLIDRDVAAARAWINGLACADGPASDHR